MSSKTRIVVLHMKELIYTAVFIVLGVLLILLLVFMFLPRDGQSDSAETSSKYVAGVYTSSITLNDQAVDVSVTVDENRINSIELLNLDESVATMYPLMEPALKELTEQIYEKQSTEDLTFSDDNKYTSSVLVEAIDAALEKAEAPAEDERTKKE